MPGYEVPLVGSDIPFQLYVTHRTSPKPLLYLTKDYLVRKWVARSGQDLPANVVVRHGVPTELQCAVVRTVAGALGSRVLFVGDLDPLDLTVFLALRAGSPTLRRNGRTAVPVDYAGIDDYWLSACERYATRGKQSMLIAMSDLERGHLQALEASGVSVHDLAGAQCARLLSSGWKLELEGASNPVLYGEQFLERMERRLLRQSGRRRR